jgi:N-acetylmuramoyl-L-alanine amidase
VAEAQAKRPKRAVALSPWEKAVAARAEFEASPADEHTKATYTHVMDGFRAIYHDDPGDQHAAEAVASVAELLAEQGRELGDAASLKSAAGQYRFLEEQYPQSRAAREAKTRVAELERGAVAAPAEAVGVLPAQNADSSASLRNDKNNSRRAVAQVTGIRHWSTATYTRVAIDLGGEVTFEAARVPNPDRIYFDLHGAKLTPELAGKSFAVTDDGFLKRIRAAQAGAEVTRVVLDVNDVTDYSAFLLPNPYRLIIDIHGGNRAQGPGLRAQEVPVVPSTPVAATDSVRASAAANASGLPAMAPTDGGMLVKPAPMASSAEGRTLAADTHVSEARHGAPTLVVAPKAVPGAAAAEVAAVSNEPGKVEATSAPTSKPIAAGVPVATSVNLGSGKRSKRVRPADGVVVGDALPAAPAKAAEKTADGETSMIRALGLKIGRIVIDAGHGGHDSGTLGADGIEEKDVVLDVALRLGKLLHDRLGAEIIYTRSDDTFIPLETRTAIANKAQADLFISIHANSSQDATARGVETYYLNFTSDPSALDVAARENAVGGQSIHQLSDLVKKITLKDKIEESREFASDVESSLYSGLAKGNEGLKNRGVKKAPFVVLIGANMPSILAEISFVTNPKDASKLRQPEYRERVAESLYAGVARYENGLAAARFEPVQRASTR